MPIIGDFQFKGGLPFPSGAAAALYPKPITNPETVVAGTSVEGAFVKTWVSGEVSSSWINDIAVDLQGNMYIAGSDGYVKKISKDGEVAWSNRTPEGYNAIDVAVDLQGNVYATSTSQYNGYVYKRNSNGGTVWDYTFKGGTTVATSISVPGMAIDLLGNVYVGLGGGETKLVKINSAGTKVWELTEDTKTVSGVAVTLDGNVIICLDDATLKKINSAGSQVWSFEGIANTDNWLNQLAVDFQGNACIRCVRTKSVHKISSSGELVWSVTSFSSNGASYVSNSGGYGIAADQYGDVYAAVTVYQSYEGAWTWCGTIQKISASGEKIRSFAVAGDSGNIHSLAIDLQGNVYVNATKEDSEGNLVLGTIDKVFDGYIIHTT